MAVTLNGGPLPVEAPTNDPYCLLCGRSTDHVGEHEGGALAGLVNYPSEGGWSLGIVEYTPKAVALMDTLGRDGVRLLVANLDRMEYDSWERSGLIWVVSNDGTYLADRSTGEPVQPEAEYDYAADDLAADAARGR